MCVCISAHVSVAMFVCRHACLDVHMSIPTAFAFIVHVFDNECSTEVTVCCITRLEETNKKTSLIAIVFSLPHHTQPNM